MFVASVDRKWTNTSLSSGAIQQVDYVAYLYVGFISTAIKLIDGDNVDVTVNMYV